MRKYIVKFTEEAKQERKSLAHIIPQKMVVFEIEIQ